MHYRVLLLVVWLVFFYNLERVGWVLDVGQMQLLTRYAYIFVALAALVTLALPALHRLPFWMLAAGGSGLFLVLKAWFGYPLWGAALTVTVTEICAILVTGLLTRQVMAAIAEFEDSIVNFTIKRVGRQTKSFDVEQGEMYQEVRRARAFGRPLTLMALEPAADSIEVATEKIVEEVQQATIKQYVLAALAKELEDQLGPFSVIAQDDDRFLILLPESSRVDVPSLIAQVRAQVKGSLGLDLRVGTATLPEIETFEGLVEAAYAEMKDTTPHQEEPSAPSAASVRKQATSQ